MVSLELGLVRVLESGLRVLAAGVGRCGVHLGLQNFSGF